jgi:hypothetical protein
MEVHTGSAKGTELLVRADEIAPLIGKESARIHDLVSVFRSAV